MSRSIPAALVVFVLSAAPGRPSGAVVEAPAAGPADGSGGAVPAEPSPAGAAGPAGPLDAAERDTLLRLAWRALESRLASGTLTDDDLEEYHFSPRLRRPRGCFVTLRTAGEVRGLQGEFEATRPLYQQIILAARRAATRDARFAPLAWEDLDTTTVEIAVIGEGRPVSAPAEMSLGGSGLFLQKWGRRALLLPGAPAGTGSAGGARVLDELCRQASLPAGCWTVGARIEMFDAEAIAGARPRTPAAVTPAPGPAGAPPDGADTPPGGAEAESPPSGRAAGRRRAGRCTT